MWKEKDSNGPFSRMFTSIKNAEIQMKRKRKGVFLCVNWQKLSAFFW